MMTSDTHQRKRLPVVSLLTHETGGVSLIGPDLSIDLDQPLLDDGGDFGTGESVLQTVSKENGEGKTFTELVRTGRWPGSLDGRQYAG